MKKKKTKENLTNSATSLQVNKQTSRNAGADNSNAIENVLVLSAAAHSKPFPITISN